MHTISHLIINTAVGLLLGFSPENALLLGLFGILIDLDHFVYYLYKGKSFKSLYRAGSKHWLEYKPRFFIFHTLEFNILLLVLGALHPLFLLIALAFAIHVFCDGYDYFLHIWDRKWLSHWVASYFVWKHLQSQARKARVNARQKLLLARKHSVLLKQKIVARKQKAVKRLFERKKRVMVKHGNNHPTASE